MDRPELHQKLVDILGSSNVYYQPPESLRLKYPCIIYNQSKHLSLNANDQLYFRGVGYSLTFVTTNPDDDICDKLEYMKYCKFDRHYSSDGLHHFVYTIYI